jgi:two-component system, OmpR family, sensor kinase
VTTHTLSIRSRLTLAYASSILLLFIAAGIVLRGAVRRTLFSEFDSDAFDSSTLVRQFFHFEAIEYPKVEQAVSDLAAEVIFPDRAIQFIRPDGAVVASDPSASHGSTRRRTRVATVVRPPARTLVVPLDPEHAPGWSIRIVSSAADLERTLGKLDRWFLIGSPFITIVAAAVGWTLAGRLLRPVAEMALAAEETTATGPLARLPIANPHDEIGRLGSSFNGLLDRLDRALSQQRQFLADAAHELRTPIARMRSLVELTLSGPQVAADNGEALALVADDLRHASGLLDELLQLARADAGERMQKSERVFLDDAAMDAIAAWMPAATRAGVSLVVGDVHEAPIRADRLLLRRLLDTVLENAVRYTPAGGRIEVSVRQSGDRTSLAVSDSGIGIPPDELPRIFERFFRGAMPRAIAPEGSGLGLPIAAWIVDQCGGTMDVVSGASGGTSVCVSLPIDGWRVMNPVVP